MVIDSATRGDSPTKDESCFTECLSILSASAPPRPPSECHQQVILLTFPNRTIQSVRWSSRISRLGSRFAVHLHRLFWGKREHFIRHAAVQLLLLCLLPFFASLSGCDRQDQQTGSTERLRPVRWQEVTLAPANTTRTFSGVVKGDHDALLSFHVPGTILALHVEVGDRTSKGQVLAELNAEDYELKVKRAQAALTGARTRAQNATAKYKRLLTLHGTQNVSQEALEIARTSAQNLRAEVESVEKDLQLAKRQLVYTKLTSPGSCSVAEIHSELNEYVRPVDGVIRVVCGSGFEVDVAVPEHFIHRVEVGAPVTVIIESFQDSPIQGVVEDVGVASNHTVSTFPVTVRLLESIPRLRLGMSALAVFSVTAMSEGTGILVPASAVLGDHDGPFVFVLEGQDATVALVRRRLVTLGAPTSEGLQIIDGLQPGERVVTAGTRWLEDGQRVSLRRSVVDQR